MSQIRLVISNAITIEKFFIVLIKGCVRFLFTNKKKACLRVMSIFIREVSIAMNEKVLLNLLLLFQFHFELLTSYLQKAQTLQVWL